MTALSRIAMAKTTHAHLSDDQLEHLIRIKKKAAADLQSEAALFNRILKHRKRIGGGE